MQDDEDAPNEASVLTNHTPHRPRRTDEASHTPSRHRVNLGPAASYYFKYMNSGRKSVGNTKNTLSNEDSIMEMDDSTDTGGDTGTISIPGFQFGTSGPHSQLSLANNSRLSIAESSSASEASDLLNKSTLSDTTELTASNFVLVTTSKQQYMQSLSRHERHVQVGTNQTQGVEPISASAVTNGNSAPDNSSRQATLAREESTENRASASNDGSDGGNLVVHSTPEPVQWNTGTTSAVRDNDDSPLEEKSFSAIIIGASPSLRSRISSSPASLRKFHENLRDSRIKRQARREEDAKRRLSVNSGEHSIHSMHAQLEFLTTDTVFSRNRLPPTFSQPPQASQEQFLKSTPFEKRDENGTNSQHRASTANSSRHGPDTSEYANLDDILDVLGSTETATVDGRQRVHRSSVTANCSSIDRALETSVEASSAIETGNLSFIGRYGEDTAKEPEIAVCASSPHDIPTNIVISRIDETIGVLNSSPRGTPIQNKTTLSADHGLKSPKQVLREVAPPEENDSFVARLTPTSKLTRSELTSTPKRILNPKSIDSPARNTRSSRKMNSNYSQEGTSDQIGLCSPGYDLNTMNTLSSDKTSRLAPRKSLTGGQLHPVPSTRSEVTSASARSDDTVSLGDIASVFGESCLTPSSSIRDTSKTGLASSSTGLSCHRNQKDLQETASISDINEILGMDFASENASTHQDSNHNSFPKSKDLSLPVQRGPQNEKEISKDTGSISNNKEIICEGNPNSMMETQILQATIYADQAESTRESILDECEDANSGVVDDASTTPPRNECTAATTSSLSTNSVATAFHGIELDEVNDTERCRGKNSDISSPNRITSCFNEPVGTGEFIDDSKQGRSTSPPKPVLALRSPAMTGFPAESTAFQKESDRYSEGGQLEFEMHLGKGPMRLLPNSHVKPTPTKLPPTPRRVLNPKNPDSPARNTRSAGKGISPSNEERFPQDEFQSHARDLFDAGIELDHEGAIRSQKRRRLSSYNSSMLPAEQKGLKGGNSPSQRQHSTLLGILSVKKNRFDGFGNRSSQRSVAFGSPEAAEYNIGSPSVNLTPMPRGRAKELFPVPISFTSVDGDESRQSNRGEHENHETVEMESDLNILVDNIRVENMTDSPALSPIAMSKMDTESFNLPGDLHSSYQEVKQADANTSERLEGLSRYPTKGHEDTTMELEVDMNGLVANTARAADEGVRSPYNIRDSPESVEMTDAESIASCRSRPEKFTAQFSVPMIAQRLDFIDDTQDSEIRNDSSHVDEGNTVELESNITSLLMAARSEPLEEEFERDDNLALSYNPEKENEFSSSETGRLKARTSLGNRSTSNGASFPREPLTGGETELNVNSRKKPLASNSFSLNQIHEEQLSYQEILAEPKLGVSDKSVSFSETTEFIQSFASSTSHMEALSPLTSEEIDSFSKMLIVETKRGFDASEADALVEVAKLSMDIIVLEQFDLFLQAVSGEVERRIDLGDARAERLCGFAGTDPILLSTIQKRLRSSKAADSCVMESFHRLVRAGRTVVYGDWNHWLGSVLESSKGVFAGISNRVEDDTTRLEQAIDEFKRFQTRLSFFNDTKVERARRKSLLRRQTAVSSLGNDVKALESQLAEAQADLECLKNEEIRLAESKAHLQELNILSSECGDVRSDAVSSHTAFLLLRVLHSWSTGTMSQTEMEFKSSGLCSQSCFSLAYLISGSGGKIQVHLSPTSSHSKLKTLHRYPGPITLFIEACMNRLANSVQLSPLESPLFISNHMLKCMWLMGRLDIVANELQVLLCRYKAKLVRKEVDVFALSAHFEGLSSSVLVEFEVDPTYPSLPVDVRLDLTGGQSDLSALRRSLIKNVKPGFGSLSRACDIIQSFVA